MTACRLIVVGCGAAKLPAPAPARQLYTGSLFRAARGYAEAAGCGWMILSALHGLVEPGRELEPYNYTAAERLRWRRVMPLCARVDEWDDWLWWRIRYRLPRELWERGSVLELHAGRLYRELLDAVPQLPEHIRIEEPLKGLQIGERLAWYKRQRATTITTRQMELF